MENEKRYNYTTPKTFLEQINLYGKLLSTKTKDLKGRIVRLVNGLEKLRTTAAQVDDLKVVLAKQEIELNEKNLAADQLIQVRILINMTEIAFLYMLNLFYLPIYSIYHQCFIYIYIYIYIYINKIKSVAYSSQGSHTGQLDFCN